MFATVLFNIIFAICDWHWNLYFRNKFLFRVSAPVSICTGLSWGSGYRSLYFFDDRIILTCTEAGKVRVEFWSVFFITTFLHYVDYAKWQIPCETGEVPSLPELLKYSAKNYIEYEIKLPLIGKWALLEKRIKEYFLTLYYTYAFRLLLHLHADPNMEKIIIAYLDDEKVVTPEGPEGTYTLDQVIALSGWEVIETSSDSDDYLLGQPYYEKCKCGKVFYNADDANTDDGGDVFCSQSCASAYGIWLDDIPFGK